MTREAFEAWISAPPYERSVERQGEHGSWPGQYKSYATQLAWEAWQESAKQTQDACAAHVEQLSERSRKVRAVINGTELEPCQYAAAIRARKG